MSCPEPGGLRAAIDGERPDLAPHLATCRGCRTTSREQAEGAAPAAEVLGGPVPALDLDVDAALAAVGSRTTAQVVPLVRTERPRAWFARAAAAVVLLVTLGGVIATPGGRSAAASILERFRAEQIEVVPVDLSAVDPTALEALAEVAEVGGVEDLIEPQEVAGLEAAARIAGFTATPMDPASLPEGFGGPVTVLAQAPQTVRVDFADSTALPAELREAVLVLHLPGAIVQTVGGEDEAPVALRGEAGMLEVTVEGGPSLAEVRDGLLSLPGLPPETVAALGGIENWETTLPLPVPAGQVAWRETSVQGAPALAFGDESGLGSVVLWRQGERFVGVGGTLPLSATQRLAEAG